ncbi:MAG: hypothetical protein HQL40_20675 [Alphaproteobacteria bacterium]|nr:hypothetical protein [Alphaproteobacteria bacterium]
MAKPPLPSRPPSAAPAVDLADPRLAAFLGNAQVQSPTGVGATLPGIPSAPAEPPPTTVQTQAEPAADTVVKDGFSMPRSDYDLIGAAQDRALGHRVVLGKSDVLRAAMRVLMSLDEVLFLAAVTGVEKLKPGRKRGNR